MKKGCLIAVIAFFGIVTIGLGVYFYNKSKKDPTKYELSKPAYDNVIQKTVATGSVTPRLEVHVKPQLSGVIDEVFVEAGQIVQKGQELVKVRLVPSPVNINNAESNVDLSKVRYQESLRELERQKEINNKSLDVQEALANFENAKRDEERYKLLLEEGVVSEQEYNQYKLNREIRETAYENAIIAAQSNVKQFEAQADIAKQEYEAALTNLQLLRDGASKKYGQISNRIVSTVDGMVLDVPVEEGSSVIERNTFNEGTSIAVVADMNSLVFEGKVDESEVGKLQEGMPIELTIGALEDHKIHATLEHIAPQGVLEEGTVKFEIKAAVVPDSSLFLRAGYSASGDIILDRKDSVLTVFERDVIFFEESDSTYVEIKKEKNKFEKKYVKVGLSDGIKIEVLEGLDTTQQIKVQQKIGGDSGNNN